jgi:hypothetical protein
VTPAKRPRSPALDHGGAPYSDASMVAYSLGMLTAAVVKMHKRLDAIEQRCQKQEDHAWLVALSHTVSKLEDAAKNTPS